MEELDLLKKYWNKSEYPKIQTNELKKMIQKRSSSTVKWILIISILEFVFWLCLNIFSGLSEYSDNVVREFGEKNYNLIHSIEWVSYVTFYPVIIYFMVRFFRLYRSISVTDNTKNLTESILTTNKLVKKYIGFNVFFILISSLIGGTIGILIQNQEGFTPINWVVNIITIFFLLIFIAVVTGIIWLFYKLLYGWLLKRLNKNYQELVKMEKITEG